MAGVSEFLPLFIFIIVVQSLSLCDPMDYSPPGSSVHGISGARYWSGLPFPSPEDLPDPGIKPMPPASLALTGQILYH